MPWAWPSCPDDLRTMWQDLRTTWQVLRLPIGHGPLNKWQEQRSLFGYSRSFPLVTWTFLGGGKKQVSCIEKPKGHHAVRKGRGLGLPHTGLLRSLPTVNLAVAPQAPEESSVHCGPGARQLRGALQHTAGTV